jgi:acetolactate synthase-1/3 small subunit
MKQIGATVGVLAAGYYREGETIDREVGLYKLNADLGGDADRLRDLVRSRRARVLVRDEHSLVVELTGCGYEIEEFYESLRPFGVMEFVRSGRVMVTREPQANSSGVRIAQGHRANGG